MRARNLRWRPRDRPCEKVRKRYIKVRLLRVYTMQGRKPVDASGRSGAAEC